MFTVKLYKDGNNQKDIHIVSAAKVEVHYAQGYFGIEVVMLSEQGNVIDKVYLGEVPTDQPKAQSYSWGVIENSEGRTTEMLRPRARLLPNARLGKGSSASL